MMVTLRLYRQHDLDLITLYRHPSFSLPAAMKKALYAYIRKEQLCIQQPEPYDIGNEKVSKIVQMHISLNEDEDRDIISWIKNIKEGYRNSLLKNIIRGYISGPAIYSYQIDVETGISLSRINQSLFQNNTKELIQIKGRGYTKKKGSKKDNRKVEDSILARNILKTDKKPTKVFVERIDDDDINIKQIENNIFKENKKQNSTSNMVSKSIQNIAPAPMPTPVYSVPILTQNTEDSDEDLTGMLDMIDSMMDL